MAQGQVITARLATLESAAKLLFRPFVSHVGPLPSVGARPNPSPAERSRIVSRTVVVVVKARRGVIRVDPAREPTELNALVVGIPIVRRPARDERRSISIRRRLRIASAVWNSGVAIASRPEAMIPILSVTRLGDQTRGQEERRTHGAAKERAHHLCTLQQERKLAKRGHRASTMQ
jgi:hypothetical protein